MTSRCCATLIMLRRMVHIGPLMALFVIFTCSGVAMIDCMLWTWTPTSGLMGKIHLGVFLTWVALILKYFFTAMFIGPGLVPLQWTPEIDDDRNKMQYCVACRGYKPLRAHHCRICRRCVMKMDHHCPWINNCLGFRNHTSFVLFLFFVPIGCTHAMVVYCVTLYNNMVGVLDSRYYYFQRGRQPRVEFSANALMMNIVAIGLALGTTIAVSVLFFQQIRGLMRNKTGIEDWIVEKAEERRRSEDEEKFVYPYDFGWKENLWQVFNWRCTPIGDGVNWRVKEGCDVYSLSIEQLKQKQDKRSQIVLYIGSDNYSGRLMPCSKGLKTCLCVPYADEPRISIKPDDEILVTRATKYWLYGEIEKDLENYMARKKGWFPRNCANRIGRLHDLKQNFDGTDLKQNFDGTDLKQNFEGTNFDGNKKDN